MEMNGSPGITLAELEARLRAVHGQENEILLQLAGKVESDPADLERRINDLPHAYQGIIAAMVLLARRRSGVPRPPPVMIADE